MGDNLTRLWELINKVSSTNMDNVSGLQHVPITYDIVAFRQQFPIDTMHAEQSDVDEAATVTLEEAVRTLADAQVVRHWMHANFVTGHDSKSAPLAIAYQKSDYISAIAIPDVTYKR